MVQRYVIFALQIENQVELSMLCGLQQENREIEHFSQRDQLVMRNGNIVYVNPITLNFSRSHQNLSKTNRSTTTIFALRPLSTPQ